MLLNLATHRKKVAWLRKVPTATFLLMNPDNTYHWLSLKTVVKREVSEDDPVEGRRVTDQLDQIWVKYTGNEPPYALRDPSMDERRVLFELEVVKVATFGRPWKEPQPVPGMPRVIVMGGSVGGLTAALVLRDVGCEVRVFERSSAALQARGAGIAALDATLRYLTEQDRPGSGPTCAPPPTGSGLPPLSRLGRVAVRISRSCIHRAARASVAWRTTASLRAEGGAS